MDRAWLEGASATPPDTPTNFSKGFPQAGNLALGLLPTRPGTYWYHAVTEEILAVIVASGQTPNAQNLGQLSTAIGMLASQSQFQQAGAGALLRIAQDKEREQLSPFDYMNTTQILDCQTRAAMVDVTAYINAAIAYAGTIGGTCVEIPFGKFLINGQLLLAHSGVTLRGRGRFATELHFVNGSQDCILIQGSGQVNGIRIEGMTISASGKTGGHAINAQIAALCEFEDLQIEDPWNGILCYQTNTMCFNRIDMNRPHGSYGFKWDAPTSANSSALTLRDVTMQGGYLGADGFIWDGWSTTLRMYSVAILSFRYGMRIQNTRASTSAYPSFGYIFDIEIDGAQINALDIEAGYDFKYIGGDITNTSGASGQGGADGPAVNIAPDPSGSNTRLIQFIGTQLGNSRQQALYANGRDIQVSSCACHDVSKAGTSLYPAIELGPNAEDVQVTGGQAGVIFGDGLRANYGILIGLGATRVAISGVDVTQVNVQGIKNNATSSDPTIEIGDCPGYATKRAGHATITSGGTSITVAHGLALGSPTSVTVSPQQLLASGTQFYGTISGGNVIIGMAPAQAFDVVFCWSASLTSSD